MPTQVLQTQLLLQAMNQGLLGGLNGGLGNPGVMNAGLNPQILGLLRQNQLAQVSPSAHIFFIMISVQCKCKSCHRIQ